MFRNKLLGIAAAATLGLAAMLGSTAAYALKILELPTNDRAALMTEEDSFTYAGETLLMGVGNVTEATDESDTTVYHNITDTVVLAAPADIGATTGDTYVVAITLDGMVFRGAQLADSALTVDDGTFDVATGGAPGDKIVVFRLTGQGGSFQRNWSHQLGRQLRSFGGRRQRHADHDEPDACESQHPRSPRDQVAPRERHQDRAGVG